jgi:transcriptional regulator with XRE-family HTH domain
MKSSMTGANLHPGRMLKTLRLEKGWKLAELATRTGFPISTLSKLENGKISLTYDKLARVSKALDVDIGVFFAPSPEAAASPGTGRRSIMRAGEGREIDTEYYHHLYQATDLLNKRFIPMLAYPRAKSLEEFGDWVRHSGEEYTYIIQGTVDLYSELYAPVRLEKGDSIYFDSGMGHAYIAVGDEPCQALTICSGDESQLLSAVEKASETRSERPAMVAAAAEPVVKRAKVKRTA